MLSVMKCDRVLCVKIFKLCEGRGGFFMRIEKRQERGRGAPGHSEVLILL